MSGKSTARTSAYIEQQELNLIINNMSKAIGSLDDKSLMLGDTDVISAALSGSRGMSSADTLFPELENAAMDKPGGSCKRTRLFAEVCRLAARHYAARLVGDVGGGGALLWSEHIVGGKSPRTGAAVSFSVMTAWKRVAAPMLCSNDTTTAREKSEVFFNALISGDCTSTAPADDATHLAAMVLKGYISDMPEKEWLGILETARCAAQCAAHARNSSSSATLTAETIMLRSLLVAMTGAAESLEQRAPPPPHVMDDVQSIMQTVEGVTSGSDMTHIRITSAAMVLSDVWALWLLKPYATMWSRYCLDC